MQYMDEQKKAAWVAALRSGAYQQGDYYLEYTKPDVTDNSKTVVCHCVQGVLARLALDAGVEMRDEKPARATAGYTTFWSQTGGFTTDLPHAVREWAGMAFYSLDLNGKSGPEWLSRWAQIDAMSAKLHELARYNDHGSDFNALADYIERTL